MRVVFDTNIYVSALAIPGGHAEEAYLEAIHGTVELFTSVAILTETAEFFRPSLIGQKTRFEKPFRPSVKLQPFSVHALPSIFSRTNRTIASSNARLPHRRTISSQEIAIFSR